MLLLSPLGLLLTLAAALPLAALALAARRAAEVRARFRLPAPERGVTRAHAVALGVGAALLGLAAAQPALVSKEERRVRTDAEAFLVVDVSRSMLAARPGEPARLARAKTVASELARGLTDIPVGVATLTDRVLPNLFPTADREALDETVRRAVVAERPPPRDTGVLATDLGALGDAAEANLFARSARHRLFVVLTDGESRPFGEAGVARRLRAAGIGLVLVHVWRQGEQLEAAYRPDPESAGVLAGLATAAGGTVAGERERGRAVAAARRLLGAGPTAVRGEQERIRPLAPWIAVSALVPLTFVLRRRNGFR